MVYQGLFQSVELKQEQVIAPHQIQSLEMLTAPYLEMQARITQEMEQNPTLERIDAQGEQLVGDPVEQASAPAEADDRAADAAEKDEFLANLMQLENSWQDYLPPSHAVGRPGSDDDERRQYFFDSLAIEKTLSDELLEQLRTYDCDAETAALIESIIGNLSDTGYLRSPLEDLAVITNATVAELESALEILQSFEPAGVGARDLRECLLLQLKRRNETNTLAYKIVDRHLDAVGRNRIPEVVKALGVSAAVLYDAIQDIRALQPRPGNAIARSDEHFVIPEVNITRENGRFVVSTNSEYTPRFRISSRYLKLLENPDTPADVRNYIKEKVTNSNLLIKSITQRQSTIQQIAEIIANHQVEFFEQGEESLRPLTMSQVADQIGVHETTVSRAIANKYVQTPRGLLPLRHFFSSGFQTDEGESLSSRSIQKKIEVLISEEDSRRPLSDKKIVELLSEQGLSVARRTVAKYREALGIPSSHMRKSFRA